MPAACEQLLEQIAARKIAVMRTAAICEERAIEGWNLESRGYVPHAVLRRPMPPPAAAEALRQVSLPL